jgi:hypothetical protein
MLAAPMHHFRKVLHRMFRHVESRIRAHVTWTTPTTLRHYQRHFSIARGHMNHLQNRCSQWPEFSEYRGWLYWKGVIRGAEDGNHAE